MSMQGNKNSHVSVLGMQNPTALWRTDQQLLTKLNIYSSYNPAVLSQRIYPNELKTVLTEI